MGNIYMARVYHFSILLSKFLYLKRLLKNNILTVLEILVVVITYHIMQQCQIFEHLRKAQDYSLEIVSAAMGIQIKHDTTKTIISFGDWYKNRSLKLNYHVILSTKKI